MTLWRPLIAEPTASDDCTIETAIKKKLESEPALDSINFKIGMPESPEYPYAVISLLSAGEPDKEANWFRFSTSLRIKLYNIGLLPDIVGLSQSVISCLKCYDGMSQVGQFVLCKPAMPSFAELNDDIHLSQMNFPVTIYKIQ